MKKELWGALALAGVMLVLAFAARFAHERGYIDSDMVLRITAMNGLMMVYFGNRVPKKVAPNPCIRQLQRVSGWTQVLSGLVYAGLWAFAPIRWAMTLGTGAVLASLIVTLGYAFRLRHERTSVRG